MTPIPHPVLHFAHAPQPTTSEEGADLDPPDRERDSIDLLPPEDVVRRAIFLASINKDDLICVAGPHGLDAMVSLCRAGYERVECAVRATCGGADEACDLLLIVGYMPGEALAEIVRRTGRLLRDGGVLIVQPSHPSDEAAIRPALAALGLEIAYSLKDRESGRFAMFTVRRP